MRLHTTSLCVLLMLLLGQIISISALAADLTSRRPAYDIRDRLLASASTQKDFPKGKWLRYKQLTGFAYIGRVNARTGPMFVCSQSEALTNMPAPRGVRHLVLFDAAGRYVGRMNYLVPLWCDGTRVYCMSSENYYTTSGNTVELNDGFKKARLVNECVCGSPLLVDGATAQEILQLKEEVSKSQGISPGIVIPSAHDTSKLDARERMLVAASVHEPELSALRRARASKALKLIMFAYVAKVDTKAGPVYVCDQKLIDAAKPEGPTKNAMVFFDRTYHYLGRVDYATSKPLWSLGGRLFLWGDEGAGNVIDLTNGFAHRRQYHQDIYASSGGTPAPQAH